MMETTVQAEANGLSVGCSIRGSGPPLVLIHGAEADRTMFSTFGAALASCYTVIAYDQRDSGLTTDLSTPPRPYGLADMADDAAALIAALGYEKAHVFGTSLGGHIAQVLAARHPARVDRLVLGSTWRAGLDLKAVSPGTAAQLMAWRADVGRHAADIAGLFFTASYLRAHPERIDLFRGGRRTAEQMARRSALLGVPYPILPGEIAAPALLVMGEEEGLIPNPATMAVAGLLREPRVEVLPGVGHIAAIEAPMTLAGLVTAFLG
nr:alpha/beta fold hydrolase [uncultured Noviherbaspirillum sp.]